MDKAFVDKIYDAYIKEDYSYGDDNLNPKHEIRKVSLRDTDDQLNKILAAIRNKVTEIAMKYQDLGDIDEQVYGNFGGDGRSTSITPAMRDAIYRAGGTGDSLVMIPSMNGNAEPIMAEIEILIPKIIASIPDPESGGGNGDNNPPPPPADDLDLFDINCRGEINYITGDEIDPDAAKNNSPENSGNGGSDPFGDGGMNNDGDGNGGKGGSGSGGSGSGGSGSGAGSGSGNDSGSGSSGDSTDSSDDTSEAAMEEAVDNALKEMEKDVQANNQNAQDCAKKDLALAKMFLMILRVIQKIKQLINPAMNIAYDIARLVVLAAGCWNNPTNIGEIIQRIIVKIFAILVMIIAMLVQMFWEMLGLDCITEQAKSVMDEIKSILTGMSSTANAVKRTAISFGANVEKTMDAFEEAKSALEEVQKNFTTDYLKEKFNLKDLSKNIYEKGLGGAAGMKNSAMSALQSTGAYDDIMSTIEEAKSMKSDVDKMVKSVMGANKAVNQTVKKISTQLHNVEVH